jgi:hypothetical protein
MFIAEYGGISYLCVLLRTPQYALRMLLRRGCCSGKEEYLKLTLVDLHALGSTVYHIWRNRNALSSMKISLSIKLNGTGRFEFI